MVLDLLFHKNKIVRRVSRIGFIFIVLVSCIVINMIKIADVSKQIDKHEAILQEEPTPSPTTDVR